MAVILQQVDGDEPFNVLIILQENGKIIFDTLNEMAKVWNDIFSGYAYTISEPPVMSNGDLDNYLYRIKYFDWCEQQVNKVVMGFNLAGMCQDNELGEKVPLLSIWSPQTLSLYDQRIQNNIKNIQDEINLLQHMFEIYELREDD